MGMQKMRIVIFSVMAIMLLSSPATYAGETNSDTQHKEGKWGAKHQEMYKDLNVTEEQKKLLEANKEKNKEQMKAMFDSMREKKNMLRQELQKPELDMAKVNQLNGELKKMEADMLDYRLARILEVRKILTPEQFKKFSEKIGRMGMHGKGEHNGSVKAKAGHGEGKEHRDREDGQDESKE